MQTHEFNDIAPELMARVNQMVWCSAATVDGQGRPRSRIPHPLWEGQVAWITTDPRSLKGRHLARHPYVSRAYVSDVAKPAYADCHAAWVDDVEIKRHVWDLCLSTPPPMGFDPAPIDGAVDEPVGGRPVYGVLELTPYCIVLTQWPMPPAIWTRGESGVGSVSGRENPMCLGMLPTSARRRLSLCCLSGRYFPDSHAVSGSGLAPKGLR